MADTSDKRVLRDWPAILALLCHTAICSLKAPNKTVPGTVITNIIESKINKADTSARHPKFFSRSCKGDKHTYKTNETKIGTMTGFNNHIIRAEIIISNAKDNRALVNGFRNLAVNMLRFQ